MSVLAAGGTCYKSCCFVRGKITLAMNAAAAKAAAVFVNCCLVSLSLLMLLSLQLSSRQLGREHPRQPSFC